MYNFPIFRKRKKYKESTCMKWKYYIELIARSTDRSVGSLLRARHFFIHLAYWYTIGPCIQYRYHIWPRSHTIHFELLNKFQRRVSNTIDIDLKSWLELLSHRNHVASLSFLQVFYGNCSDEFSSLVPRFPEF